MRKTLEVASVVLSNDSDQILLLQRIDRPEYPERWEAPGGTKDQGEDPVDCALRELREETLIDSSEIAISGIRHYAVIGQSETILIDHINARFIGKNRELTIDPSEHIAYRWWDRSEIFSSNNLLPLAPTMIARTLDYDLAPSQDLTIEAGLTLVQINAYI